MGIFNRFRDRDVETETPEREWGADDTPERIAEAVNRDYTREVFPVDPEGPFYGPVAQGLSLSGPMGSASNVKWNSYTDLGDIPMSDVRDIVNNMWSIHTEDEWMNALNRLLNGTWGDSYSYRAADIRTEAKRRRDVPVLDDATWAQEIRDLGAREDASAQYIAGLVASIPEIRTVEDTMRRARLLSVDEEVEAMNGYDLVRLGNMARWGVAMGWGSPTIVENVALHSRDVVLENHSSWRSYGLSLTAGRMVTYPETWGKLVVGAIEWVRPYFDSVHSPWNHLPFPDSPVLSHD